jgi:hypothetical protein
VNDRAVSDTVGFVLAFALITATVGAVYATGFTGLLGTQRGEQVNNVERAFDVLDDNVEDVYQDGAPSRATEIQFTDGSLSTGEPVKITVQVNSTATNANATYVMQPRPIVFESRDGSRVAYVADAVIRSDGDSSYMRSGPAWLVDGQRAVVPFVVTLKSGNRSSIGGTSTVLVTTRASSRRIAGHFPTGPGEQARVNVTVESPRADAWKGYFEKRGFDPEDSDASDGTVTYQFTTNEVYVPETVVDVAVK